MDSSKTDLAIYLPNFSDGGVSRIVSNLVENFILKGIKIDLILNQRVGANMLRKLPSEVQIFDLKANKFIKYLPRMINYLRERRPKSLLAAVHKAPEVAIIAKYLSGVSTRIVVSERTNLELDVRVGNPSSNRIKSNLIPLAVRFLYPFADSIIAISQGLANDLSRTSNLPRDSIHVIYNPTIGPRFKEESKESVDHPWFNSRNLPIILAAGRLERQKDFATLIRAFALVKTIQPAKLVILGCGREEEALSVLINDLKLEDDVQILGFVENPYSFMDKASVFVMSSAWEGFGNVLVEAMAVGTPVISTRCPNGPEEILNYGQYGELVPVGDSQAMAKAILKVLSGSIKTVDMKWLDQFKLEPIAQQYRNILKI